MRISSNISQSAIYSLEDSPLDLRASAFVKLKNGTWWLRLLVLVSVDSIVLSLAWLLAEYYTQFLPSLWHTSYIPGLILVQIAALILQGTYGPGKNRYNYFRIAKTLAFAHGAILIVCFLYLSILDIHCSDFIFTCSTSVLFVCVGRFLVNLSLKYLRRKKLLGCIPVCVICDSENKERAINLIEKERRYIICQNADANSLDKANRQKTLKKLNELGVTEVFISWDAIKNRMFLCWLFQASGITVHILPLELKPIDRDVRLGQIGGITCLTFEAPLITGKDFWIKKRFDFFATVLFLMFFFPVYIAISIAIKLDSPGPVFYRQTRIGLGGKEFKVFKFRTMRTDADKLQKKLEALNESKDGILFKIKDDPRVTKVGKFLRYYSLDELPQLFNVLLGEMSLVGPRPLPTRDVDKFSERHFIRQEVLPGITGMWQVSGRSDIIDFEQVIKLDLTYIENWSLWLDFQILLKTVQVVLNKEGAY